MNILSFIIDSGGLKIRAVNTGKDTRMEKINNQPVNNTNENDKKLKEYISTYLIFNEILSLLLRVFKVICMIFILIIISKSINEIFQLIKNNTIDLNSLEGENLYNRSFYHRAYRIINNINCSTKLDHKIINFIENFETHPVGRFTIKSYFNNKLPNVNIIDCNGNTPLVYAIKNPSLPIVEALINKGADVNYLTKKNNSDYNTIKLIFRLVINNNNKILIKLLDSGLNPNIRNSRQNLLDMAFIANNYEIFSYLLEHSTSNFNIRNISFGNIEKIIKMERLDILKFLVEVKGLNIKKFSNSNNLSLLDKAFITKNFQIYSYIMEKGPIKFKPNNFSFEHLEELVKNDELSLIQKLVDNNIDLKDYSKSGDKTIIDVAFQTNNYKMYSYLIRYGLTDFKKNSVTYYHIENIIKQGDLELLKILVNNNVDLNKFKKSQKETLLNLASKLNDKEMLAFLYKYEPNEFNYTEAFNIIFKVTKIIYDSCNSIFDIVSIFKGEEKTESGTKEPNFVRIVKKIMKIANRSFDSYHLIKELFFP
ncbi:ankyrin [Neocallimastix sp. 'constans']